MATAAAPELATIKESLVSVQDRITKACAEVKNGVWTRGGVRLVAVSKTKPPEAILEAYNQGQRHFGENYVKELVEKSLHPILADLDGICWHFIGHLQRNKVITLLSSSHIWCVETVDSDRLATALNTSWERKWPDTSQKLNVFVQVNTSQETGKSGCTPERTADLVWHIQQKCTSLQFKGLMTIGRFGHDYSLGPNPDFESLSLTQVAVCKCLGLPLRDCELSMGMSADFEHAITAGSTNVRVGTTIFGKRDYPVKTK